MDREQLVEAMAEVICVEFYSTQRPNTSEFRWGICMELARATLAVAEPAVRADERLACLNVAHRWTRDGHSATAHGIILGIEERTGGTP